MGARTIFVAISFVAPEFLIQLQETCNANLRILLNRRSVSTARHSSWPADLHMRFLSLSNASSFDEKKLQTPGSKLQPLRYRGNKSRHDRTEIGARALKRAAAEIAQKSDV